MKRNRCHDESQEENNSYSNSGAKLHFDNAPTQTNETELINSCESIIEETVKAIQKEARIVESEANERIQEKSIRWAKTQLFFLSLGASSFIVFLGFFGYKEYSDFQQTVYRATQQINSDTKQMKETIDNAKSYFEATQQKSEKLSKEVDDELSKLKKLQLDIKNIDPEDIRVALKKLDEEFRSSIGETRSLIKQAKADREETQKLQHSFFAISIHVDGNEDRYIRKIPVLLEKLNKKGFFISKANIAQIGVNFTEIIYYNLTAKPQSQLIARTLGREFPGIKDRLIERTERNPREILIKLKM